jgi:hypothetical protein
MSIIPIIFVGYLNMIIIIFVVPVKCIMCNNTFTVDLPTHVELALHTGISALVQSSSTTHSKKYSNSGTKCLSDGML